MKLLPATALAVILAAAATPALAQYGMGTQPTAPQQVPQAAPSSQAAPAPAAGPQAKPSAKAQKALLDLQDTINKKDWANLPAKVAAAQAAASTKDDRYLVARLQLNAAVAQNDPAAMQAALDAVAQTGFLDAAKTASLYVELGKTQFNNKQ